MFGKEKSLKFTAILFREFFRGLEYREFKTHANSTRLTVPPFKQNDVLCYFMSRKEYCRLVNKKIKTISIRQIFLVLLYLQLTPKNEQ